MNNILVSCGYEFKLVDRVPEGYEIWNIGSNMMDGYLPLVKVNEKYEVVGEKLAIKTEGSQIILSAIGGGQKTIKSMERYIKRYKNSKPNTRSFIQSERIKKALPFMYKVEGLK